MGGGRGGSHMGGVARLGEGLDGEADRLEGLDLMAG